MYKKMLGATAFILVSLLWFGTTQAAREDVRDPPNLEGLPGIRLVVEQIDPDAARIGLDRKTLRTQVATQLHRAGIPLVADGYFVPILRVRGRIVTRLKHPGVWAYSTEVRLEEHVHLCRSPHELYRATTWSSIDVGLCDAEEVRQIRGAIETQIEEFIRAYREGNPKGAHPVAGRMADHPLDEDDEDDEDDD